MCEGKSSKTDLFKRNRIPTSISLTAFCGDQQKINWFMTLYKRPWDSKCEYGTCISRSASSGYLESITLIIVYILHMQLVIIRFICTKRHQSVPLIAYERVVFLRTKNRKTMVKFSVGQQLFNIKNQRISFERVNLFQGHASPSQFHLSLSA